MSRWPATRAARVYAALRRIGWELKRQAGGPHRVLSREGFPDFVWAFHDRDEIGPRMLARIAELAATTGPPAEVLAACHPRGRVDRTSVIRPRSAS